jgi:hypothetical protein
LAYNFNKEPGFPSAGDSASPTGTAAADSGAAAPSAAPSGVPSADPAAEAPLSAGFARFNSCRWQQPKEEGSSAFCTHREVKPYAGTAGFDADAWCPECQYFKLRRAPKKRSPSDDYSY